jgi:hypothetical protein
MNKIFISIASKEKVLGEVFSRTIDHIFAGKLSCSLLELKPGDEWKRKIKQNLTECNILVSFLTPFYTERPWAYVEWAAFWFSEDKHTILILPEQNSNQISQLFDPFHDVQAAFIDDEESIRHVLQKIQEITGIVGRNINSGGNELSKELVRHFNEIQLKRKIDKYSIFKTNLDNLPFYDNEIKEIALHFYDIHDSNSFMKISERILSEETKYEIAKYILLKKDYTSFKQFLALIDSNDKLLAILRFLIYHDNHQDTPLVIEIIEKIKATSETSLITFCKDLVRNDLFESAIFNRIIDSFELNSTKRNIYLYLVEKNIQISISDRILEKIDSNVERVKIAIYYARSNKFDIFVSIMKTINNTGELFKLFRQINEYNLNDDYFLIIIKQINTKATISDMISYARENHFNTKIVNELVGRKAELID